MRYLFSRFSSSNPNRLLIGSIGLTLVLVITMGWSVLQIHNEYTELIQGQLRLQELIGTITYLDEALTTSARTFAATGTPVWEEQYFAQVDLFDAAYNEIVMLNPALADMGAAHIDEAYVILADLEVQSFELASQGQNTTALDLLLSPEYQAAKQTYTEGQNALLGAVADSITANVAMYRQRAVWVGIGVTISVIVLSVSWISVLLVMSKHEARRQQAEQVLQEARND
ncbi:MAG: hypothetical protein F6K39_48520 [Okeania sp. SIO3B3]|nr:hypothetical protein [Okeania sp. SIO3B3]